MNTPIELTLVTQRGDLLGTLTRPNLTIRYDLEAPVNGRFKAPQDDARRIYESISDAIAAEGFSIAFPDGDDVSYQFTVSQALVSPPTNGVISIVLPVAPKTVDNDQDADGGRHDLDGSGVVGDLPVLDDLFTIEDASGERGTSDAPSDRD